MVALPSWLSAAAREEGQGLAFTRYFFTSPLYCGSQSSFYCPPPAKPILLQSQCTAIAQYTPPHQPQPPPFLPYTIQFGDGNIV